MARIEDDETGPEGGPADAENATADVAISRQLSYIHQTLELIALLLALLLVQQGGIGVIVGAGAAILLVVNAIARSLADFRDESVAG